MNFADVINAQNNPQPDAQASLDYLDHPAAKKQDGAQPPAIDPAKYSTWADLDGIIGPVVWIWKPWLANGILSLLAAYTGEGKSLLLLHQCGCFQLGWDFPDGTKFDGEKGKVLWCEAEAAQAINLQRAKDWKMPLDYFISPIGDPSQDVNLDNPTHRELIIKKARLPEVKLICIDSLKGSSKQDDSDQKISEIVQWFAGLLRDVNKPGILTHHLNKPDRYLPDKIDLFRVRGTGTIVQFTRVVWALSTPDPDHKENKRLEQLKNNLARFPEPIGMIAEDGRRLQFGKPPEAPRNETQFDKARDLIQSQLAQEPQPADDMYKAAQACGISERTLNAAKKDMRIVAIKKGKVWFWGLPNNEKTPYWDD